MGLENFAASTEPDRFTNLAIKGFRRLQNVEFQLRPLCVMIGANGVGKTSMLDVFSLLASSAAGRLSLTMSELGGLNNVLSYSSETAKDLDLGVDMAVAGNQPLQYRLRLRPQGVAYQIEEESLSQKRKAEGSSFYHLTARDSDIQYFDVPQGKLLRPNWEHDVLETSLSQVPKTFQKPEEFRNRLASSTFYHVLDVSPRSPVRLPQPMQPATLPSTFKRFFGPAHAVGITLKVAMPCAF